MAPACPECGSMHIRSKQPEGRDWTEYECLDCGHEWSHRREVRCPLCGEAMRPVYGQGPHVFTWDCPHCRAELRRPH